MLELYAQFFAEQMRDDIELLVIANHCSDGTEQVVLDVATRYPQVKLITENRKVGKGGAIILGAKQATGDYIGFVDADGATSPSEFYRLYKKALGSCGVVASRWIKGADVQIAQKAMRLLSSRAFNWLTRILLGLKYKDTQCGAKIFSASAWSAILPKIGTTRFAFDVDLLFQLKRNGSDILEEPTVWKDVEGSKVNVFNTSLEMFLAVIRMRLLYSPFKYSVRLYDRFFSRIVDFLRRDALFCHVVLLFMAAMVSHVCNISFQWVVSRKLSPEDYALLAVFLSLFAIVSRPLTTLSTTMVYYTSLLVEQGRVGAVKRLIRKWIFLGGIPAVCLAGVAILFAPHIAALFGLERVAPVIVFACALPALFMAPIVGGAMSGMQQFGWSSVATVSGSVSRVLFGVGFVVLLFPACGWALLGHVAGIYATLLVGLAVLLWLLARTPADEQNLPSFRLYLVQCFFIQLGMAVLLNGDVVFVKHFVPDEVGFAKAATLGRMVVFFTTAVAGAMFPKVTSKGEFTAEHKRVFLRGILYTVILLAGSFVLCFFCSPILHRVLFHIIEPTEELIWQTRGMAAVMGLAVLLGMNNALLLAQKRFKTAAVVPVCAVLYFLGIQLFHETAFEIMAVAGACNGLALIVTTYLVFNKKQ